MSFSIAKLAKLASKFHFYKEKLTKKEDLGTFPPTINFLIPNIREDSNERLIKKLGDEILKFQETLNVEKKVT